MKVSLLQAQHNNKKQLSKDMNNESSEGLQHQDLKQAQGEVALLHSQGYFCSGGFFCEGKSEWSCKNGFDNCQWKKGCDGHCSGGFFCDGSQSHCENKDGCTWNCNPTPAPPSPSNPGWHRHWPKRW